MQAKSVEQAFQEYQFWLLRFIASRILNLDAAKDLVQEVFLRVLSRHEHAPIKMWKPYLRETALTVIHEYCTKPSIITVSRDSAAPGQEQMDDFAHSGIAPDIPSVILEVDCQRVLNSLKHDRGAAFRLREEGYTYEEIGAKLGLTKGQVQKRIAKARSKLRNMILSVAAVALIFLAVLREVIPAYFFKSQDDEVQTATLSTKVGEHRCELLPERSQVCLSTNSVVSYRIDRAARSIEVISGEASFVVRNDTRPFDVRSGSMMVRDLSTSFDIYKKDRLTLLTVIDGKVAVAAPVANASTRIDWAAVPRFHELQQVEFDEVTRTLHSKPALSAAGMSQLLAWRKGMIDLTGRSLDETLHEFARYQPPTLEFNYPPEIGRMVVIGGEVDATDLKGFLHTLEYAFGVDVRISERGGKTVVTLSHHRNPAGRSGK